LEHLKLELRNTCLIDYDIHGKPSPIQIRDIPEMEHMKELKDLE